ncbi:DUF935 family protein [Agarivorans sp. B2Z047]|uniref:DUF935 domain-containing protein n=1 Tax=Agarivorans sp. B2Z047 TaxID=2652721 RepID=UPI0014071062|nr:DUF935 domain-containing protein [Agarivorans sp. B2Z047]MPW30469.1 DUF935 family protein [Agarivorans sp. B2Z047]UQN42310.1 DUF935 domain-containing protein [Agarivorans sp. B2Z047]
MNTIIDPRTGEPFKADKTALSENIAKAYTTSVRTPAPSASIATGLTPAKLASVLRSVIDGSNVEDYMILAEEMEERELHYRSVLSTRKLSVAGLPIEVHAASDDARDVELADEIRELMKNPQIPEVSFDLLDGLGKGLGVVQILWNTSNTPWLPLDFKWVDPRFLKPDDETLEEILLISDDNIDGEPLEPYKFMIHTPRTKSGKVWRNGLARLVAVMYMLKSFTLRDWWAFAEVFGIPVRVGKYGPNASEDDIQTLVSAIRTIASDAGAAIPQSMEIELIESAKGNGGDTLFQNMAQWCDKQISKAVLGQTMTTEDGSSRAQASVHNEVREDIIEWDARQLAATYNEYLVKPYILLNYGEQDKYPSVEIKLPKPEDLKAFVDAIKEMVDRGLQVRSQDVLAKFGLAQAEEGDDLLRPLNQPTESLGLNARQGHKLPPKLALNRRADNVDSEAEIAAMVDEVMSDWVEVGGEFINPILELAKNAKSYQELSDGLAGLHRSLDTPTFQEQLALYLFKSRGLGDVSDG